jgi:hypothetical protein
MADTSNIFMNRRNPSWLNQYYATSGKVPSAGAIQEMVAGELDAAAQNRYRSKSLSLQEQNLTYLNKMRKNQERAARAGAIGDIFKAGTGALTAYAALKGRKTDDTDDTGFFDRIFGSSKQPTSGTRMDDYENYLTGGIEPYGQQYSGYEDYGSRIDTGKYDTYEDKAQEAFSFAPKFKNIFDEESSGGGYDFWSDIMSLFS